MSLPPLRGRPGLEGKSVLLTECNQPTRDVRAEVLESYGVRVCTAEDLLAARFLWKPNTYDWILIDVRRYLREQAVESYARVKDASPRQRFAFLVGPPLYVSPTWRRGAGLAEKQPQPWAEMMKTFMGTA